MVFSVTPQLCAQFVKLDSKTGKMFKADINFWSYNRGYIEVLISIKLLHVDIQKH
jgi:hypothetical protein